jgi:hypothetical protein
VFSYCFCCRCSLGVAVVVVVSVLDVAVAAFSFKVDITILLAGTDPTNLLDGSGILSSVIDSEVTGGLSFTITSSTSALVASTGEQPRVVSRLL